MIRTKMALFTILALLVLDVGFSGAATFTDDFEGSTLDPFWSTEENSGSITFPSTTQVYSGSQSIQFNSISDGGQKGMYISHTFAESVFGQVSVWMYDTRADMSSGNYISLHISNSEGVVADLSVKDYDGGPGAGGEYYYSFDSVYGFSEVDRTVGWHQFTITSLPDEITLKVDDTVVYSAASGMSFDTVRLSLSGPSWRPAMSTYFDNFEVTIVPEPISSTLFIVGGATLGFRQWRKRKTV